MVAVLNFLCEKPSIGLVSFSGLHVCRFDINLLIEPVETIPVGLKLTLRELACLDDFIGGLAWILGKYDPTPSPETGIEVSLAVQDFEQVWGPIWLLGGTPLQVPFVKTESSFVIPLSGQIKMTNGILTYHLRSSVTGLNNHPSL